MKSIAFALFGIGTIAPGLPALAQPAQLSMDTVQHLHDYQVVELRRYTTSDGERAHFVQYFDTYFPEAFEQLGAMVFGQFAERANPNGFTWLRGFKDINARPGVNAAFYYGPLWREHRVKVNAILPDSDNVMLLRPLHPERGVSVLPAVDPVLEPRGAHGVVVAQIFPVVKGHEDAFAQQAEREFSRYAMDGVRSAGVLVTLDVPNNFPQLPIRTDGPWLVWLGIVQDDSVLKQHLVPQLDAVERELGDGGSLRGPVERVVMDPTPRSRLRWLGDSAQHDQP